MDTSVCGFGGRYTPCTNALQIMEDKECAQLRAHIGSPLGPLCATVHIRKDHGEVSATGSLGACQYLKCPTRSVWGVEGGQIDALTTSAPKEEALSVSISEARNRALRPIYASEDT